MAVTDATGVIWKNYLMNSKQIRIWNEVAMAYFKATGLN
jgi:hypothetical protein